MPKKAMNLNWFASSFMGVSIVMAMGAGSYLAGKYRAEHQIRAWQKARVQVQMREEPTGQPDLINGEVNTDGKQREATWSSTGDTIFAFGNQGCYLFAYRNEPDGTSWRFQSAVKKYGVLNTGLQQRMSRPYFFAFTSTDDELVGYMDSITEKPVFQFHTDADRPAVAPTYTSLLIWLNENVKTEEDMLHTKVIFGAKSTYFASNGKKCIFHDLPPTLHNFMLEKKHQLSDPGGNPKSWIPRIVALGANDNFVAIWQDGDKMTALSDHPSIVPLRTELAKKFQDTDGPDAERPRQAHQYENIVLSPFNVWDYFCVKKTGHTSWCFSGSSESQLDIKVLVGLYSQMRAKEDGTTFKLSSTTQGVEREIDIGPKTDHSESDIRNAFEKPEVKVVATPSGQSRVLEWVKSMFNL